MSHYENVSIRDLYCKLVQMMDCDISFESPLLFESDHYLSYIFLLWIMNTSYMKMKKTISKSWVKAASEFRQKNCITLQGPVSYFFLWTHEMGFGTCNIVKRTNLLLETALVAFAAL